MRLSLLAMVLAVAFRSSNVHLHEYPALLQLATDLNIPLDESHGDPVMMLKVAGGEEALSMS